MTQYVVSAERLQDALQEPEIQARIRRAENLLAERRAAIERERENREAWRVEREKLARADREDLPLID